jgi:hypothetical protein
VILLVIFCVLKLRNRRAWVRLGESNTALHDVTSNFERNSGIALTAADDSRGIVMQTAGQSSELFARRTPEGFVQGARTANDV